MVSTLKAATASDLLAEGTGLLADAGIAEARRRARQIVCLLSGVDPAALLARPEMPVPVDMAARCRDAFHRYAGGEPIARITGMRAFWRHDFSLSSETLDPRPETETLIKAVLDVVPDPTASLAIADLGTGTGAIALSLLGEFVNATALATDRSESALETARRNADVLGVSQRVAFLCADWLAPLAGQFDVIVSNPPYIRTADLDGLPPIVRDHDPRAALDGGADGLDAYRAIASDLGRNLRSGGWLIVEIGEGMVDSVLDVRNGHLALRDTRLWSDLSGKTRVVGGRLR